MRDIPDVNQLQRDILIQLRECGGIVGGYSCAGCPSQLQGSAYHKPRPWHVSLLWSGRAQGRSVGVWDFLSHSVRATVARHLLNTDKMATQIDSK
jgi:hypothetical protein